MGQLTLWTLLKYLYQLKRNLKSRFLLKKYLEKILMFLYLIYENA